MRRNEAARTGKVGHQDEGFKGDWQNISFEKRVTKSSFAMLTVPAKFVRQHGDKFQQHVLVQTEGDGRLWTVKVSVAFPHGRPQVWFSRGWNKFVVFHGLVQGDRMTINLVAMSKFKVSIARSSENSKARPRRLQTLETSLKVDDSQRRSKNLLRNPKDDAQRRWPKKLLRSRKDDSRRRPEKLLRTLRGDSQRRRPKKLLRPPCFVDLSEEEPEVRRDECHEPVAKDWEAVKAETTLVHSISNATPAAAAGSSLSDFSDMDSHYFEPVQATAPLPFFYS